MHNDMIIKSLKNILKEKKITYKELASEVGMSESGLKKLLTAKDISLNRLSQIATALGISFPDLVNQAFEEDVKNVSFSEKQERALISDFLLFRVLWRICIENRTEDETAQLEGITPKKLSSCLLKLENLDLIKINKLGKIISIHKGLYRWKAESPLVKKLNKDWSKITLDNSLRFPKDNLHHLSYLQLSTQSVERLFIRLQELADEFARISNRDKLKYPTKSLKQLGLLIATSNKSFLD